MFLSCGDALFDVFADEEADASKVSLNGRVGGSPLNVALGLARLGHPSAFLTCVSSDLFGRRIRAFMAREAIDGRFLVPTRRNTTLAMVALSDAGVADYSFYIEGTADRSLEPADLPADLGLVEAVHVGSYSTAVEPSASALEALVARERGRLFVSYDPNIRTSIEPDLDLWREKVSAFTRSASLVKASAEDLEQLYPGRTVEAVLGDWIDAGAALGVVTRGQDGALALSASGARVAAEGLSVAVVDTVGAGDTFQAALLAFAKENGLLSRAALAGAGAEALGRLLAFAVRASAVTCSRRGADLPRRADLGLAPLAA